MLLKPRDASFVLIISLMLDIAVARFVKPTLPKSSTTSIKSTSSATSSHLLSLYPTTPFAISRSNSTSALKTTSTSAKSSKSSISSLGTTGTTKKSISSTILTTSTKSSSKVSSTSKSTSSSKISSTSKSTSTSKTSSTSKISSTCKTSTTTSASASATASSPPGPRKRGLPYNDATLTNSFGGPNSQISWGYNWGQTPGAGFPAKYEYVPLLWSNASDLTSTWFANVNAAIAAGTTHILAFNEPDYSGQANMSPLAAAQAYMKWMQPFAGKVKLGAPVVTNGGPPMGVEWLKEFMALCPACTIDFVPLHWYDGAFNYAYFRYYIENFYAQIRKPIWITEFNGYGDDATVISFLKKVMPWLDSLSYVERYAWFWCADGNLLSTGTNLSDYGVVYMNYTSTTVDPYFSS
ncbi:hypothetical protein BP6252_03559 [Coleophoma cylindrospora]|uniref:Asl1-like glycosyl hydrolase catalytic domain-containing protein n=1 Tax=Coleophoma cylindrospora TaxID=1849047 RepID=A0A3D8S7Z3_9HELO|nr:hypothetical protein BP6252_03559 [Coleophoma cylindrospora]